MTKRETFTKELLAHAEVQQQKISSGKLSSRFLEIANRKMIMLNKCVTALSDPEFTPAKLAVLEAADKDAKAFADNYTVSDGRLWWTTSDALISKVLAFLRAPGLTVEQTEVSDSEKPLLHHAL